MKRILIVEPDKILGNVFLNYLSDNEFDVICSHDANDAIIKVDQFKPDLILLELRLIGNSGVELLREIRSYTDLNNIKIIILSMIKVNELSPNWERIKDDFDISTFLYKPETKLVDLLNNINRTLLENVTS